MTTMFAFVATTTTAATLLLLLIVSYADPAHAILNPEFSPRPLIRGYSTTSGICDPSTGTLPNGLLTQAAGTLRACATRCMQLNSSCAGFNFWTDQNKCQLFATECSSTIVVEDGAPRQNYYSKGEFTCFSAADGNEYFVAFMSNRAAQPKFPALEMWLTQDRSPRGNVTVKIDVHPKMAAQPDIAPATVVQLPYKGVTKVSINPEFRLGDHEEIAAISPRAIRLSSKYDFAFYGVNKEYYTTDAFLGLSSRGLGTRYVASCHWPPTYNCEMAFTPVENGTTIKVTLPRKATNNVGENWPPNYLPKGTTPCAVPFEGATYSNGDSFTLTLNQFEAGQVQDECDLTGAIIESNKPIAAWSGNSRAAVGLSKNRDHLVEQLLWIETWGSNCAAWPTPKRAAGLVDYWVLTALKAGTRIRVDSSELPVRYYNLDAYESVRFLANSVNEVQHFSSDADHPFQAMQFAHSAMDNVIPGDPSMTTCIPTGQFGYGYSFVTPTGVATSYTSYLTIVTDKGSQSGLRLDNVAISSGMTWKDIPNSNLVTGFVQLDRAKQTFRIEHTNRGVAFAAYVYGSGDRESFGYPTGLCLRSLAPCSVTRMVLSDAKDNDCDGIIDEELLDNIDNDLDGLIDEDCYAIRPCDCCPSICPDIPQISGGYTLATNIRAGDRVTYKCLPGLTLVGSNNIVCTDAGQWSGPAPKCQ